MIQHIDDTILNFFGTLHTPILDRLMIIISAIGNAGMIWIIICAVMMFIKRTRKCGVVMAISLILILLICNVTLKPLIARARPFNDHNIALLINAPSDWSFPSGHAASSFAAATSAVFTLKKRALPLMALAVLIAFSRLYLQVHYFSDVMVGCLLGSLVAVISNSIVKHARVRILGRRKNDETKQ